MFASALLALVPGLLALVLPGLGQPAAEWRRIVRLLRAVPSTPQLGVGRAATLADFDLLARELPALAGLSQKERRAFVSQACVIEVPMGTIVVSRGEKTSDVYFILSGRAVAGIEEGEHYRSLETMHAGDFFGEIAALMDTPRTANVFVTDPSTLLKVPASAFRNLTRNPNLIQSVHLKSLKRMSRMSRLPRTHLGDLPRVATMDQGELRALRQNV